MKQLRIALAGLLALFVASAAVAQTFPTVPGQSMIGRLGTAGQSGPSQAIPLATLRSILNPENVYDTVTAVSAAPILTATKSIRVLGYLAVGDGGAANYTRSVGPAGNGKIQSADGTWWLLNETEPNELQFGAVATASNAAQTAAIQAMFNFCTLNVCNKARIVRPHTQTAPLSIPAANLFVEWESGNNLAGVTGMLIKGFNGDMITVTGTGTILQNPFLNGQGGSFTGGGIVWTGNFGRIYNGTILDNAGAGLDFPTGGSGTRFFMENGIFTSHSIGQAQITMPATELTTTGYRTFSNVSAGDGGTLIKFNNGNITQIIGGSSGTLDYSATTTGRISVINHRAGGAVTIFGTEGHFEGNTAGTSVTLGAGTTLYSVANNIIAGGIEPVDSSGSSNNRIGVSTGVLGTNNQILFGVTGGQPLYRTVTGDVTFSTGVATIGATKVTNAMLNADVFSTAHTWAGIQTFTNPVTATATVVGLPACAGGTKGMRSFVTDNNTALSFAAVITSGGTIQTPVYCDGTTWRQG